MISTANIQHLGECHLGVISERYPGRNESNIASEQSSNEVLADLDSEHALNHLKGSSSVQGVHWSMILGLAAKRDSRESVVSILRLLGRDEGLHNLVSEPGAQILGPITAGKKVRLGGASQGVVAGVPL